MQTCTAYNNDLRRPLVLPDPDYVVSDPSTHDLPVIHYRACGTLHSSDFSAWSLLDRKTVQYLFDTADPANRAWYFCQTCIAGDSHPLMIGD